MEVRSKDEKISRIVSKQNLNTVIETNNRRKNTNQLFDKFWYKTREDSTKSLTYDGFYVDSANLVASAIA